MRKTITGLLAGLSLTLAGGVSIHAASAEELTIFWAEWDPANYLQELVNQYEAETVYVSGEFYWPVVRGQKTSNIDFANGKNLLSLEQSPKELTWSVGTQMDAAVVAKAFGATGLRSIQAIEREMFNTTRALVVLQGEFAAGRISLADFERATGGAQAKLAALG